MSALTSQDITQLLAAVETWEHEPVHTAMQKTMLGTMLGTIGGEGTNEERSRRAHIEAENIMRAGEAAGRARREEAILLQAKLLTLRNELQQAEFTPAT